MSLDRQTWLVSSDVYHINSITMEWDTIDGWMGGCLQEATQSPKIYQMYAILKVLRKNQVFTAYFILKVLTGSKQHYLVGQYWTRMMCQSAILWHSWWRQYFADFQQLHIYGFGNALNCSHWPFCLLNHSISDFGLNQNLQKTLQSHFVIKW